MPGQVQRAEKGRKTLLLQSEVTLSAHTKSLQVLLGENESDDRQPSRRWAWTFHHARAMLHGRGAGALGASTPAEPGLQGQPVPIPREQPAVGRASQPLCVPMQACLWRSVFFFFFSGTDNSGNKIPSPENGPIQLQIPLCLCQQRAHQTQSLKELQHPSLCFHFL